MDIVGDRRFVEIPGASVHELPPLLVRKGPDEVNREGAVDMASKVIEYEDLVPSLFLDRFVSEVDVDRRKMDMALNLVDVYLGLVHQWNWGDGILEWIRQCEITFEHRLELRNLLRPDVWPHAGRASFVTLLEDMAVASGGVNLEAAVGLRLTFRQPPPLEVFSDQFLFYLNHSVANSAYKAWADLSPNPVSSLPPERFHVQVLPM